MHSGAVLANSVSYSFLIFWTMQAKESVCGGGGGGRGGRYFHLGVTCKLPLSFLAMTSNISLLRINTHYEICCEFPNACDIWFRFVLSADKESTYP